MFRNILIGLGLVLLGAALGRFALPAKVVEKEHIVVQEKIVVKEVESKSVDKKDNKVYIHIITTKPDGTKVEETKIVDRDSTITIDKTAKDSNIDTSIITDKQKTTEYESNVLVALGMDTNGSYDVSIQKKLLGPIYMGVFGSTSKILGISIGFSL